MTTLFEIYIRQTRQNFVKQINNEPWNTQLRTQAENLLIAYDQMVEKVFEEKKIINR